MIFITIAVNSIMIKKTASILLSIILLFGISGITFSMHYCGENLISLSVFEEAETCCSMEGNCCHNETFQHKIETEFLSTKLFFNLRYFTFLIQTNPFQNEVINNATSLVQHTIPEFSPPLKLSIKLALVQAFLL